MKKVTAPRSKANAARLAPRSKYPDYRRLLDIHTMEFDLAAYKSREGK